MIVKLKEGLIGIWGTCRPDSGIYQSVRPVTHLESRANCILKVHHLKNARVELSEEHESFLVLLVVDLGEYSSLWI
jgi:hypothetical protein